MRTFEGILFSRVCCLGLWLGVFASAAMCQGSAEGLNPLDKTIELPEEGPLRAYPPANAEDVKLASNWVGLVLGIAAVGVAILLIVIFLFYPFSSAADESKPTPTFDNHGTVNLGSKGNIGSKGSRRRR